MQRIKKHIISLLSLLLLIVGGLTDELWALDEYETITDFDSSSSYSGTNFNHVSNSKFSHEVNHVTFEINDVSYYNTAGVRRLDYADQAGDKTVNSNFTWEAANNYSVSVTNVSIGLRAYRSNTGGSASAYFTDGTTTGSTVNCKTMSTGTNGAQTVSISASPISSPLTLVKQTVKRSHTFTITSVTYTYKVTHKKYLYGFDAVAVSNNASYGSVSTSGKDTVRSEFTTTTATKQVTFTATPKTGYHFVGWYTSSSCSGDPVSTSTTYKPTLSNSTAGTFTTKELYAKFAPNTYSVAFDGNGNTGGSMSTQTGFVYDQSKALTSNAFTKTGYTFAGWSTTKGGSKAYNDGQSVSNLTATQGATVTLYAVWTAHTYSVAFDGNGNTGGSMSTQTGFAYNQSKALTSNAFTKTGYTFAGWSTTKGGSKVYSDGQSVSNLTATQGATVTLYAVWTANTYYVAFDGNGSTSGSMSKQSFTYDAAATALTSNAFTKTGYTFAGWSTTKGGSKVYNDGQNVSNLTATQGATVTLYAVWTANTYSVAFDGNGNTGGSMSTQTGFVYDQSKALTSNAFTKTGYTFAGWSTTKGGSKAYNDGQSVSNLTSTNGAIVTLYAVWTANTYSVAFDGNGNTDGSMSTQTGFVYDESKALTSNAFTQTGYTFAGWSTTKGGSKAYNDGQSVSNLTSTNGATVTLYAVWTAITVNSVILNNSSLTFKQPQAKDTVVIFNVSNANNKNDFTCGVSGAGWSVVDWSYATNQVTVTVRYTCTATTTQGAHAGTVTLTSEESGHNYKTANVVANVDLTPTITASANTVAFGTYTLAKSAPMSTIINFTYNSNVTSVQTTGDISPFTYSLVDGALTVNFVPTEVGEWTKDLVVTVKNSQTPQLSASQTIRITGTAVRNTREINKNTFASPYLVDAAALDLLSMWTSTGDGVAEYKIESFAKLNDNNAGLVSAPTITTNQLSLSQAGTLVISMVHRQTTNYEADSVTQSITINKRSNTLVCDWDSWTKSLYLGDGSYVNIHSDNAITPIVVTQTKGDSIATFWPDSVTHDKNGDAVYSSHYTGQATWSVTQAENYKYVAATPQTLTVNVAPLAEATDCYVLANQSDEKKANLGETCHQHTWDDENAAGVVSFEIFYRAGSVDPGYKVQQLLNGEWSDVTSKKTDYTTDWTWKSQELNRAAKGIRFWGSGSLNNHVRNVSVKRATYLEVPNLSITKQAGGVADIYPNTEGKGTLVINYSLANGGPLRISCDNDKFAFTDERKKSSVNLTNSDCSTGTFNVPVYYTSNVAGTDTAHVVIYNNVYRVEATITGTTKHRTDNITWNIDKMSRGTYEDNAATATLSGLTVYYRSNNTDIIEVINNTQLHALAKGSTTITAYTEGNGEYAALESPRTIEVTDSIVQYILWTQNFRRLTTEQIGSTIPLTAKVYVPNNEGMFVEDAARTALLEYSSSNSSVVSVAGTTLTVVGQGNATLTARVPGSEPGAGLYIAGSVSMPARVSAPSTGCETLVLDRPNNGQSDYLYRFFQGDLFEIIPDEYYEIDRTGGKIPDKLSFGHKREYYHLGITYSSGSIKAQQRVGGNWIDVPGSEVTPSIAAWNDLENLQLNENADAIRFVRPENGTGYHYVNNVRVTLKYAFTVTPAEINFGSTIKVDESATRDVTVNYSNVQGNISISKNSSDLIIDDQIDVDCGALGSQSRTLRFKPTKAGEFKDTLRISDLVSTRTIPIYAMVQKGVPTLNWSVAQTELSYNASGTIYTATSTSKDDEPIVYSITEGNSYATINASTGVLTILEPGHTITIQASQAESDNYVAPASITVNVTINAVPKFTNDGGDNEWENPDNWENGIRPDGDESDVIITGELVVHDKIIVGGLTIESTGGVIIVDNGTLNVTGVSKDEESYGNLHVQDGGIVELGKDANLKVGDFILDAKLGGPDVYEKKQAASSGQVQKSENLTIKENAYFQMEFDPKGEISYGWYDFVVPFEVNVTSGLFRCNNDGTTTLMVSGEDFVIQEYDESKRASNIPSWTNFSGIMQPGRVYTIAFNYKKVPNQNAFLFKKVPPTKGASEYGTNSFTTSFTKNGNGGNEDKGWNGLGNGTFSHVQIKGATKDTKMQIFNHASNSFSVTRADTLTFAVGTSFFIQVDEEDAKEPIELEPAEATEDKPLLAPAYNGRQVNEFCLALTLEGAENESDRIWVSANEDATGEYVIGRDLLKMGSLKEAKVARIWAKRNNLNLCDAEMPLVGSEANCDLNIFAPQEGTYVLGLEEGPEDATLYLTYNGKVIWDLSTSPASLVLNKGTKEGLGLRIKSNNSSEVAEGVDETNADNQTLRKVLIDNTIYVITPDGAMYDLTGKMVK